LRADVGVFFKELRRELGGKAIPYLWVPEWHPGGHGLHVHFAVGRYIGQPLIREIWDLGHVHIKLLGDLPVGSGSLAEARLAARYLSKYASKAVEEKRRLGYIATKSRRDSSLSRSTSAVVRLSMCSDRPRREWADSQLTSGAPRGRTDGEGHLRFGLPGMTDLATRASAWVDASCAEQGVPVKITDPAVLSQVAGLLGALPALCRQPVSGPAAPSGPPDGGKPGRIEAVEPLPAAADDNVVEDGGNDRVLPSQWQACPTLPQIRGVAEVPDQRGRSS